MGWLGSVSLLLANGLMVASKEVGEDRREEVPMSSSSISAELLRGHGYYQYSSGIL